MFDVDTINAMNAETHKEFIGGAFNTRETITQKAIAFAGDIGRPHGDDVVMTADDVASLVEHIMDELSDNNLVF